MLTAHVKMPGMVVCAAMSVLRIQRQAALCNL